MYCQQKKQTPSSFLSSPSHRQKTECECVRSRRRMQKNHFLKFFRNALLLLALDMIHFSRGIPLKNSFSNCGYKSCPIGVPDKINVHIISHSHWDVGWLKTVDQYFYGDKNNIDNSGVQYIIDTVLDELQKDPQKRFVFVETAYIWRWWLSREEEDHQKLSYLIQSGQLEIIGGGWSMNDEATTHYMDTVDQFTWGLRFLNDTFGECARPRVGWQIDPFGHSRESGSLFAQMGYDGVFFGRIDYQDKANREQSQSMEFVWNASANLGENGQVFGVVLPNLYFYPSGFCFDILCADEPIKDNKQLKGYNVDKKVDAFLDVINNQSKKYATNNLIVTMGQDFNYQDARTWFLNLDKLIKYVNARQEEDGSRVNVFYSTPSCYLQALNQADRTWPVKTDDFFPYASDPHSYWTGYFTSRPTFKYYTKYTNNILQVAKQLSVIAQLGPDNEKNLEPLKRYQGEAQHHDAITGTEAQHVTNDYTESLSIAVSTAQVAINNAYDQLIPKGSAPLLSEERFCHFLNVSYCNITETQSSFTITAYNPLAHTVRSHIRVPVTMAAYSVMGPDGRLIHSQLVPVPQQVQSNPEHKGKAHNELVFGSDLPPLGFSTFFVQSSGSNQTGRETIRQDKDLVIQNEYVRVTVDTNSGLLKSITNLMENATYSVRQNFYYYQGMAGNNSKSDNRASGAYIFRPDSSDPVRIGTQTKSKLVTVGSEVQEIHQTFSDYVSQVIRVYKGEHGVEFEWQVGPIPITDGFGKEVISRFDTDLATEGFFYTDSNGREILERKRNYRPTWNANVSEPISGNYYPVNTRIYIKDDRRNVQLTVVTDRPQGGSSITDGSLELMLHRRLLYDDGKGVNEALDEPGVDGKGLRVRGKQKLLMTSIADASQLHRAVAFILTLPPVITITPLTTSVDDYRNSYQTTYSGLTSDLPGNVHLLTLEPWKDGTILLRLEHYFEKSDDPNGLSQPVTVNLKKLFTTFTIVNATETSLGANVWLQDVDRFKWTGEKNRVAQNLQLFRPNKQYKWRGRHEDDHLDVTLEPMQIKTFLVTVARDDH